MRTLNSIAQAFNSIVDSHQPAGATINGGKGITIDINQIHKPDFENYIPIDYQGRAADLVICHIWNQDSSSYTTTLFVRLAGQDENFLETKAPEWQDLWVDASYALWYEIEDWWSRHERGEAGLTFQLPDFLVQMIEEVLDDLARAEALA